MALCSRRNCRVVPNAWRKTISGTNRMFFGHAANLICRFHDAPFSVTKRKAAMFEKITLLPKRKLASMVWPVFDKSVPIISNCLPSCQLSQDRFYRKPFEWAVVFGLGRKHTKYICMHASLYYIEALKPFVSLAVNSYKQKGGSPCPGCFINSLSTVC